MRNVLNMIQRYELRAIRCPACKCMGVVYDEDERPVGCRVCGGDDCHGGCGFIYAWFTTEDNEQPVKQAIQLTNERR